MLDAYIIDAIRQEEEARRREAEEGRHIYLELPLPPRPRAPASEMGDEPNAEINEDEPDRGVVVIPLHPDLNDEEDAA